MAETLHPREGDPISSRCALHHSLLPPPAPLGSQLPPGENSWSDGAGGDTLQVPSLRTAQSAPFRVPPGRQRQEASERQATEAKEAVIMLKTIIALLWEPLKKPPKEVINHQKKKKRLCTVFIKRNSQLIQSCLCQVRGVGRDSLSPGVSNSQMNWVLFLEEIPWCRVSFLWLVTSRGRVLNSMGFIDKYWSCSSSTPAPALQQTNFILFYSFWGWGWEFCPRLWPALSVLRESFVGL